MESKTVANERPLATAKGDEEMTEQNCAHEDCACLVQDDNAVTSGEELYCSKYCAKAGPGTSSEECECGHEECV
jgi:hypothetical protein